MGTPRYSIQIYSISDEEGDEEWVALTPEFPGFSCFGKSRFEVLDDMERLLEFACSLEPVEGGDPLPSPITLKGYENEFPLQPYRRK